jgi:GTP-binding protein
VKFIDETFITVTSGDGGNGCVSFRREKFIPRGGPDGGNGGRGGHVILRSSSRRRTLYPFRYRHVFKAARGANGQGNRKTGKNGRDVVIEVPVGTVVRQAEGAEILKDFGRDRESFIVLEGGRGGKGNHHFKSATHRTPRFAQPGEPGQTLNLKLELKLLADVGIVGFPNAGKSTLIRAISSARPKIADYPFTTLAPSLGVVQAGTDEPIVVADIPGLIEDAHKGAGLGTRFLKHIERTRVLLHLIDASVLDPAQPLESYQSLNRELSFYSLSLSAKPQLVVLNKMDLPGTEALARAFQTALTGVRVLRISAAARGGLRELIAEMAQALSAAKVAAGDPEAAC